MTGRRPQPRPRHRGRAADAALPPRRPRDVRLQLVEASTGAEGLAAATAHTPDVILLDLGLPDMDGLEVTRRLREWTTVPIIVLSARGQDADKVAALDAGADDYLTKPFSLPELMARIRVALRHAARARRRGERLHASATCESISATAS